MALESLDADSLLGGGEAPDIVADGRGAFEVEAPGAQSIDLPSGERVTEQPDGALIVDFEPGAADRPAQADDADFGRNLAEDLDGSVLARLADDIIAEVEADEASRKDWEERYAEGLKSMGVIRRAREEGAFPGAADVVYPLISTAVVQFNARALDEMFPATGPVKGAVIGKVDAPRQQQALRVERHMNYQLTVEDPGYFADLDQMLFYLPQAGSAFKKTWTDPVTRRVTTRYVKAHDLIVPYTATSLETAPRLTHRQTIERQETLRRMESGFYVKATLGLNAAPDRGVAAKAEDEADGRVETYSEDGEPDLILESHALRVIRGLEHLGEDGKPSGLAVPYIVHVHHGDRKVLAIYRNWKEDDALARPRKWFVHYRFLPGLGFYGWGFFHVIGSLDEATTGALRAMLDSAAFAAMQGGFKSKDVRLKGGEIAIEPGRWKDVDATAEELQSAFYTPPFKDVPPALFQLLGLLAEAGQRFSSTTESMVGDAANTGPVGTTVALIEQGSKVFSAIHKRMHQAAGEEFALRAELNGETLDEQETTFDYRGGTGTISRADYDGRVDVIPVSDPNIFSATQRIAMAQALVELAVKFPDRVDGDEALSRMLDALRTPDPDRVLLPKSAAQLMDPVSENMALLTGRPVRAYPGQNHDAHIQVHLAFMQHPQFGGLPDAQKAMGQPLMAHLAEHAALLYQQRMAEASGVAPVPIDFGAPRGRPVAQPIDPTMETAIAVEAARAIPQFMAMAGIQLPAQPDPAAVAQQQKQAEAQAELQAAQAREEQKQALAQQAFQAEEARRQQAFLAEQARLDAAAQAELRRKRDLLDAEMNNDALREHLRNVKTAGVADAAAGAAPHSAANGG